MDIKVTQTITPSRLSDKPDAVKIDLGEVTILVNLHTGTTTVDGADHVHATSGEHNTMEITAVAPPIGIAGIFLGLEELGEELAPGIRIGLFGPGEMPPEVADLLARGSFKA